MVSTRPARSSSFNVPKTFTLSCTSLMVALVISFTWVQRIDANEITLAWDKNIESEVVGYSLFYRVDGLGYDYSDPLWQGTGTMCTVYNLEDDTIYYFVIRAIDAGGNQSSDSTELYYKSPPDPAKDSTNPVSKKDDSVIGKTPGSNLAPSQPIISSHYDGQMECEFQPRITTEAFSDPNNDFQLQSQWQISKEPDFDTLVLNVITDRHLEELVVPSGILESSTVYYVRIRYYDTHAVASSWSEPIQITTQADVNDTNGNGIDDAKEVGYGVDMDGNGVSDNEELDRIKTVRSLDGDITVGILADSESISNIEVANVLEAEDIEDDVTKPDLPFGVFSYRVRVNEPGATARVTVFFSEDISSATSLYKYDTIIGWQDYSQYTTFNGDGRSITLEVKDGGYGDSDGIANGIIVDPGGLSEGVSIIGGSSNVGGCFIKGTAYKSKPIGTARVIVDTFGSGVILAGLILVILALNSLLRILSSRQ